MRRMIAAILGVLCMMLMHKTPCGQPAPTTAGLAQNLEGAATATLSMGDQFFPISQDTAQTTIPTVQLIADETSATIGPVVQAEAEQTTIPVSAPTPEDTPEPQSEIPEVLGTPLPSSR